MIRQRLAPAFHLKGSYHDHTTSGWATLDTNWWAILLDGGIPTLVATVVTIQMALLAVRAERNSRMNERRLDMGFRFLEALQATNFNLGPNRRQTREQLRPTLIHFSYIYGTYGRFRHFAKYMAWMQAEIMGIDAILSAAPPQRRLTDREMEDLNDTFAVMISSTIDWMMMDEPKYWTASKQARTDRAIERGAPATDQDDE